MRYDRSLPYSDIVVISDLHCGSVFGLWPDKFVLSDGGTRALNPGQDFLLRCWRDAARRVARWCNVAAYVVNGDVIDGVQRRQEGVEAVTVDRPDQAEAARVLLQEFVDAAGCAPMFFVQGTEYHDARNGAEVERVAEKLGGVSYGGVGMGRYSKEVLDLSWDGVNFNFAHAISVSSGLYRETAPGREGVWSALSGKSGKLPHADVITRSHAHYFVHVEHESKNIAITPCWQLQTRYMRRHSVYRMVPSVGLVFWRVWRAGSQVGDSRVELKKILYPLPDYKPHVLTPEQVLDVALAVEEGERGA